MKRLKSVISIFMPLVALVAMAPGAGVRAQNVDLTGIWRDDVGREYRVRQVDSRIYWSMDRRPESMGVFQGRIEGNMVRGDWADLPGGQSLGNGRLVLRVESSARLVKTDDSGGYPGRVWTKQDSGTTSGGGAISIVQDMLQDRWSGNWCLTSERYTMNLKVGLTSINGTIRSDIPGRKDPIRLLKVKRSGNTIRGEWESDPRYSDEKISGKRYGVFDLTLNRASSPGLDRLEGTAHEDRRSLLGEGDFTWVFVRCDGR